MEELRQNRAQTGIPRRSKVPMQSANTKLPLPRTNAVKMSASRNNFTSNAASSGARRVAKHGMATSHEHSSTNAASPTSHSTVTAPSQLQSPSSHAQIPLNPALEKAAHSQKSRPTGPPWLPRLAGRAPVPVSWGVSPISTSQSSLPWTAKGCEARKGDGDGHSLWQLNSQQWISAPMLEPQEAGHVLREVGQEVALAKLDQGAQGTMRTLLNKPRSSLAERTIETLSQLPSSPAIKGRTSASFYSLSQANKKSHSRPGSRSSRPGSSHQSNVLSRTTSRSESRPGSSCGPEEKRNLLPRGPGPSQIAMTPVEGTPNSTEGRSPISKLRAPSVKTPVSKGVQKPVSKLPTAMLAAHGQSKNPGPYSEKRSSPENRTIQSAHTRCASKTATPRSIKPTKSLCSLHKKHFASAMKMTAPVVKPPRKVSSGSQQSSATSNEGRGPSGASTTSISTTLTVESPDIPSASTFQKSSATLREQIAKAKAAKRSTIQKAVAPNGSPIDPPQRSPLIPSDDTFDFGLASDPFNQRRDERPQVKALQSRLASARTSGRLNIADMGLREIPPALLNMYSLEASGGAWAESVDLTRFVAADNELEMIDDTLFPDVDLNDFAEDDNSQGNIFGGLETLDLHGNMLIALPMGLRRLSQLTSLNLSQNRLANNSLELISQITSLRDLKLGGNLLYGPLDPCFSKLCNLETIDLHGNNLSALPSNFGDLARLKILNISENAFESLPFKILAKLPLTDVTARKNQLSGVLFEDSIACLPSLQMLDISSNQLTYLTSSSNSVDMPALHQLCVSMNRLQALPDMRSWNSLVTLAADENSISTFPEGLTALEKLRSVDFSSNDICVIPAEVGHMDNLAALRLSGNPLRDKKFCTMTTDELKATLALRLEPPSIPEIASPVPSDKAIAQGIGWACIDDEQDDERSEMDSFATPPTSLPSSPLRARAVTTTSSPWLVKAGGVLDRSNTQSSSLHPIVCSQIAAASIVREVRLDHNLYSWVPDSLSFFAGSLAVLSLSHNHLVGESYIGGANANETLELPALTELSLCSNRITNLAALINHLLADKLQKLDVSYNRIAVLPSGTQLRDAFPNLAVLLMSNNQVVELQPEVIQGMRVVDAANNDIAHLNPRIGLLGGKNGLEKLELGGNRFRVPRYDVLQQGTEATLEWLRDRVPVAEMGAWKEANDEGDDE